MPPPDRVVLFRPEGVGGAEVLHPTATAASQWADGTTMRGLATSALMARGAERAVGTAAGLRPVRWTADLSRPVPLRPTSVHAEVVRSGRRLRLVDVELVQGADVVARARGLFLKGGGDGAGEVWAPDTAVGVPSSVLRPDTPEPRLYFSEPVGWTSTAAAHHNAARKQIWTYPLTLVEGEGATPFQLAAGVADLASVVCHWGTGGIGFINADITLSLARLPRGPEIGIAAVERIAHDGIAIGTALVHDRDGVLGTATVSALGNAQAVDPAARDH